MTTNCKSTNRNPVTMRHDCTRCGDNVPMREKSIGSGTYRCDSDLVRASRHNAKYDGYTKLSHCEACGYVSKRTREMEVHHVNGSHEDNHKGNHKTLCVRCHQVLEGDLDDFLAGRGCAIEYAQWQADGFISKDFLTVANKAKRRM